MPEAVQSQDFGKILFERKSTPAVMWSMVAITAALAGVALRFTVFGAFGDGLLGYPALIVALAVGWATWQAYRTWVVCYERGLVKRTNWRTLRLAYADAERLWYGITRVSMNGAEVGEHTSLSVGRAKGWVIEIPDRFSGSNSPLNQVRDVIVAEMVGRWLHRLDAGEEIEWGSKVVLTAAGLKLKNDTVSYSEPLDLRFADGKLKVGRGGKPLFELACDKQNFWPGLAIYERRARSAQQAA